MNRYQTIQSVGQLSLYEIFLRSVDYIILMAPILFAIFISVEFLKQKTNIIDNAKASVPFWTALALIPQCGFSVACAELYAKGRLLGGTLIAVFIMTTDGFLPIVLAEGSNLTELAIIMTILFVYAVIFGTIMNKTLFKDVLVEQKVDSTCCSPNIFKYAFAKTFNICVILFISNIIIELIFTRMNNQTLSLILMSDSVFQPFLVGLIGLIPNCCVAIIVSQLFLVGAISVGSTITALACSTGFGYLILFRLKPKDAFKMISIVYFASVFVGVIVDLIL